ncbi:MAG TPA: L-lactate dehydrogenase [Desulfosalsimonadaceae bacterium]|nr:L-lactate dehydrogenase [Desulfosalsimonadaceae bacterium]
MPQQNRQCTSKVVIVGAGAVGATFGYALALNGVAGEIVLLDRNRDLAEGQALDLAHGQPYFPIVTIRAGTPEDYADAAVIVITAGAKQEPGESRLELLRRNAGVITQVMGEVAARDSLAVVIMVSNPVDVLTQVALQQSGFARSRVIGSGTVLDSSRFRYLLSRHCGINTHNVHAYMLGEHGDSEFAAWSMTHIGGIQIDQYCPVCGKCDNWMAERAAIEQTVRDSAYHIIDYKGATYFAVGLALVRIVESILRDQKSVLTVSTYLEGEFGLSAVCLSVPAIVSAEGVERIIAYDLPDAEKAALKASAEIIARTVADI